jgi:hypothetical protein
MKSAPREFSDDAIADSFRNHGVLKQWLTPRQPDRVPSGTVLAGAGKLALICGRMWQKRDIGL